LRIGPAVEPAARLTVVVRLLESAEAVVLDLEPAEAVVLGSEPVEAVVLGSCLLLFFELVVLDLRRWLIDLESNGCPLVN